MMKYKGYIGHVGYDDEAKIFHGEVIRLRDIITFQGKSVEELEEAFKESVDDYLNWCKKEGRSLKKHFQKPLIFQFLRNFLQSLPFKRKR